MYEVSQKRIIKTVGIYKRRRRKIKEIQISLKYRNILPNEVSKMDPLKWIVISLCW